MKVLKIILAIPIVFLIIMYVLYFSPLFKHHFPTQAEYPIVTMTEQMVKQIHHQTFNVTPIASPEMDGWDNVRLTFPNSETKIGRLIFDKKKTKLLFVSDTEIFILR